MKRKIDKTIEKIYSGELIPIQEIYEHINSEKSRFNELLKCSEQIEAVLKQNCDTDLLETYIELQMKMQYIVSQHSFQYGMKLGAHLVRDL